MLARGGGRRLMLRQRPAVGGGGLFGGAAATAAVADAHRPRRRLHGLMQHEPLLISGLIEHAAKHHHDAEIVSRRPEDGAIHRYNYRDMHRRSKQLANVLEELGVGEGDRVGTLAVNTYRHMEIYYAVSGSGRVLHTLNPRLFPDTLVWIAQHASDKVIFFDLPFLPLVQVLGPQLPQVSAWVCMVDEAHMPTAAAAEAGAVPNLLNYEALVEAASPAFRWPVFEETRASSLCYTSGTTGKPKGVLYSHRSTVLHSYAAALPDSLNLSARDCIMPVVPLFHVNAWGLPYSAALVGSKLVLPGSALDGKSLYELMEAEQVTCAAGVPTVWLQLLTHVKSTPGARFSSLTRTVVGGAACPSQMLKTFVEEFGVDVLHAWGMTELSPLGTSCTLKGKHLRLDQDEKYGLLFKQGRAIYGVDLTIVDTASGEELPWDGKTFGELAVRGNWIVSRYFKMEEEEEGDAKGMMHTDREGREWFLTGDVATIDADGFVQIVDRSKGEYVIKTGGEWVSSLDLENCAMSHPQIAMAAVIGLAHPKWDERPLLVAVKKEGAAVTKEELLAHFKGRVAKWWIPDDVVFVDSIALGPTGKVIKVDLRKQFKDYQLPPRPGSSRSGR